MHLNKGEMMKKKIKKEIRRNIDFLSSKVTGASIYISSGKNFVICSLGLQCKMQPKVGILLPFT